MKPHLEDYHSDSSDELFPLVGRRSPIAANVSTERTYPTGLDLLTPWAREIEASSRLTSGDRYSLQRALGLLTRTKPPVGLTSPTNSFGPYHLTDGPLRGSFNENFIASHTITGREKLGNDYIARLLAEDEDMRAVCSKALERLDRERFVQVGRKTLRSFHQGLLIHAKTELEQQSARLLRSYLGRRRICEGIADLITSEKFHDEQANRGIFQQERLEESPFETLMKDVPHTRTRSVPTPTKQQEDIDRYRDSESQLESEDNDLRDLAKMREFLRKSEPFQTLLNDLRIQLLPCVLRDIIETASYGSLSLSAKNNKSLVNRTKAFIEDFTVLEWNWWPLEPRMRNLAPNEIRLFWQCVSKRITRLLYLILSRLVVRVFGRKSPRTTQTSSNPCC
jgi:hypothetical protein